MVMGRGLMSSRASVDLIVPDRTDRNVGRGTLTSYSGLVLHVTPTPLSDVTRSTILVPASGHIKQRQPLL